MNEEPLLRQGPPPPARVTWRVNDRKRGARVAALLSIAMSGGLFTLTGVSLASGDRGVFTLFAFVISLFLLDGAFSRLLLARKAPTAIGLSDYGLHIRKGEREVAVPWGGVTDLRFASVGPRPDTLVITLRNAQVMQYSNVMPAIASEAKLAWLEAQAHERAAQPRTRPRVVESVAEGIPADLLPSGGPQYWVAKDEGPRVHPSASEGRVPAGGLATPEHDLGGGKVEAAERAPLARPEWGYTRPLQGVPLPDPLYHSPPSSLRPLVWHFVPTGNTRSGLIFLIALLVLAAIAVARIAADALMSFAGYPSDPWTLNLIGLSVGAFLGAGVWVLARRELAGEVAGSVIFLPAFDRTKVELVSALREAGVALDAGDAMERRSRGRLTLQWRQAGTRAVIVQAAPDIRAVWLRTVGRSHFEMHARLKGAILERLGPPGLRK